MVLLNQTDIIELEQLIEIDEDALADFFTGYGAILGEYGAILGEYEQRSESDGAPPVKRASIMDELDGGASTLYCDHKIPAIRMLFNFVISCVPLLFLMPAKKVFFVTLLYKLMKSIFKKTPFTDMLYTQITDFIQSSMEGLSPKLIDPTRRGMTVVLTLVNVGVLSVVETLGYAKRFLARFERANAIIEKMTTTSIKVINDIPREAVKLSGAFTTYQESIERFLCSMVDSIALSQTSSEKIKTDLVAKATTIRDNYNNQSVEILQTLDDYQRKKNEYASVTEQKTQLLEDTKRGISAITGQKVIADLEFELRLLDAALQNDIVTLKRNIASVDKQIQNAGEKGDSLRDIIEKLNITLDAVSAAPLYQAGGKKRKGCKKRAKDKRRKNTQRIKRKGRKGRKGRKTQRT